MRPARYRDDDGAVRVVCEWPRFEALLAEVYLALRAYAMDQPLVVRAGIRMAQRLEPVASGTARDELRRQIGAFASAYAAGERDALEAPIVRDDLAALEARLAASAPARVHK